MRVEGFEDPLEEGQKNSIISSLGHLRSPASAMPAAPGRAAGKFDGSWGRGEAASCAWVSVSHRALIRGGRKMSQKSNAGWSLHGNGKVMSRWKDVSAAGQASGLSSMLSWAGCGGEAAATLFFCSGLCQHKEARLWAWSRGGGRCHTVLQKIALGCSRTGIVSSHGKPWAR